MVTLIEIKQLVSFHEGSSESLALSIFNLINDRKKQKKPSKPTKNSKESIYLEKCAKMCKYPVDIENKFISVPAGFEDVAKDDLTVSHLLSSHGFFIQSCIPDAVPDKDVFNPEFSEKKIKDGHESDLELPKRGEVWRYRSERWYIKKVDDSFHIAFLGDIKSDSKKTIDEVQKLVNSKELVKEAI